MITLDIVGGFLGAGKTTWLARQIAATTGWDAVVVNELAHRDLDGDLIRRLHPAVFDVPGGCVCCDKREEFERLLETLVSQHHRTTTAPLSSVVLETSGAARLEPILGVINGNPRLAANVRIGRVWIVLDGLAGAELLSADPIARAQVQAADVVVLSRSDLDTHGKVGAAAATAHSLNPSAAIRDGHSGQAIAIDPSTATPLRDIDTAALGRAQCVEIEFEARENWGQFVVWLEAMTRYHPRELVRVKGTVRVGATALDLQVAGPHISATESDAVQGTRLAMMVQGMDPGELLASLSRFVAEAREIPSPS